MTLDRDEQIIGNDQNSEDTQKSSKQDSGLPGGGVGRRDDVGHTGVYPLSASEGASGEAPIESEAAWGQGQRGAEGYNDSGDSGLDAAMNPSGDEQSSR